MDTIRQDISYSIRMLFKNPAFALVTAGVLALGIGICTTIFSVVYGTLLRPLPYAQADRLMQVVWNYGDDSYSNLTANHFQFYHEHNRSFEALAAYTPAGFSLVGDQAAARVSGLHVSADYLRVLSSRPLLGRGFLAEDDLSGAEKTVILSHGLWNRRFGADERLIGRTVRLNGTAYTIIGVMPPDFRTFPAADVWTPIAPVHDTIGQGVNYQVIGRLKPETTRLLAQEEFKILSEEIRKTFPQQTPGDAVMGLHAYRDLIVDDVSTPLLVIFGAIGFVLLIACANIANLLLARAVTRRREMALRAALGAGRRRLIRQLLTESMMLALVGGAIGVLIAHWGLDVLTDFIPRDLPRLEDIQLDGRAVAFSLLVSLATGLLFGLAPALQMSDADLNESLKAASGRITADARRGRLRRLLTTGEIALSLVLLIGAALLIETFANLTGADPGFDPQRILSQQLWLTGSRYETTGSMSNYFDAVVQEVERLPGVQAAGVVAAGLPLERGGNTGVKIPGRDPQNAYTSADFRIITPGYFGTLNIPLLQGRLFGDGDTEQSTPVVIISARFAERVFPDDDPIGRTVGIRDQDRLIVGVVGDVKSFMDRAAPPTVFMPAAQTPFEMLRVFEGWFPTSVVVRTEGDPLPAARSVQQAIQGVDTQISLGAIRPMEEVFSTSIAFQRFNMLLISLFAGLAAVLATLGIYGVISFMVGQRIPEIGLRMALGARPNDVLRMIIGQGLRLTAFGVVIGVAAAFGLTRLLAGLLFGVGTVDPAIFIGITAGMTVVALLATVIPARRAVRVDPLIALRND